MQTESLTIALAVLGVLLVMAVAEIGRLRAQIREMSFDPAYGCLTRQGVEQRARPLVPGSSEVLFFDIDDMHGWNAQLGYAQVDRHIREALASVVMRTEDVLVGRWYSGDELFGIVEEGTAHGLCKRLLAALQARGMTATFGIVPYRETLVTSVERASDLVRDAKAQGVRGQIRIA